MAGRRLSTIVMIIHISLGSFAKERNLEHAQRSQAPEPAESLTWASEGHSKTLRQVVDRWEQSSDGLSSCCKVRKVAACSGRAVHARRSSRLGKFACFSVKPCSHGQQNTLSTESAR